MRSQRFEKRQNCGFFFFLAPNFGLLSKFLYQLFLIKSAYFANNLKNELFEGRDELFEQLRVSCRHHEPHFRSLNVLMRSMCRRKSACVVARGEGQQGVQSEWVGTTCFRRLVQKDSCFEHDQVRHVLQSACKCSSADYRQKPETAILTVAFRVFDVCAPKFICPIKHACEGIVLG